MNPYLIFILVVLLGRFVIAYIIESLNVRSVSTALPQGFSDVYDSDKYALSQKYLRENTRFSLIEDGLFTAITVLFILAGGFNWVDTIARDVNAGNSIVTGLIFAGILFFASSFFSIPFSSYRTFVIEEKYGFNRTTIRTFILDILKTWVVTAVIGSVVFAAVIWFFTAVARLAWVYCWVATAVFELFLMFIAPVVILPLFNKFVPLKDGPLKESIEAFARKERFPLRGIYTVDASRRSSKSNAYFIGFGRFRRIGLFDTLIERHTVDELVSVLAHEIGHYKKHHFIFNYIVSAISAGIMFYILSFFINNTGLFAAFGMRHLSVYASLFFFGFLYTPINMLFSIVSHVFSRRHEYEADAFAVRRYGAPDSFIRALKKLAADNLSNLTPHPLKVFVDYSHPPLRERIQAIEKIPGVEKEASAA